MGNTRPDILVGVREVSPHRCCPVGDGFDAPLAESLRGMEILHRLPVTVIAHCAIPRSYIAYAGVVLVPPGVQNPEPSHRRYVEAQAVVFCLPEKEAEQHAVSRIAATIAAMEWTLREDGR